MATVTINDNQANDLLDSLDATYNSGTLELRSGSSPGAQNTATGTLIASIAITADSFAAAASRAKGLNGLPLSDTSADNAGTLGYFRLKNAADTRRIDGDITATGGGGAMTVDNTSVTAGQKVTVTALNLTA